MCFFNEVSNEIFNLKNHCLVGRYIGFLNIIKLLLLHFILVTYIMNG
jgi:hypothetical protein